jgi:hypothetical protein
MWDTYRVPSEGELIFAHDSEGKSIGTWVVEHVRRTVTTKFGKGNEFFDIDVLPTDQPSTDAANALLKNDAEGSREPDK